MADALDLLKTLVGFPSLSGEEGPVADFVEAHVRAAGLPVEVGRVDDNVRSEERRVGKECRL